jgi:23S rRNA pseudouridine1911/1915/1917 synthase
MGTPAEMLNRGHTVRRTLDARARGSTVLEQLSLRFEHAERPTWVARLDRGEILLDGERTRWDCPTRPGQVLAWARPPWREPEAPLHFELLHEDEHLLAVSKPSGLPTLPGAGFQDHTLLALVRAHAPLASPMHRLGRGTTGVVLFCKTAEAAKGVQAAWRRPGAVRKRYLALLSGLPSWDRLEVEAPIGRAPDPVLGWLYSAHRPGKPSRSHFELIERRDGTSLARVDIDTGRPHQIRIHAAWAGHPLVGDPLYGPGGVRAAGSQAVPGDLGYHLHARRLVIEHPITGETLRVEAPAPATLRPLSER